jgi:hypothetical protein
MCETKKRGRGRPRKILDSSLNPSSSKKIEFPVVRKNTLTDASEIAFVDSVDNIAPATPVSSVASTDLVDTVVDVAPVDKLATSGAVSDSVSHISKNDNLPNDSVSEKASSAVINFNASLNETSSLRGSGSCAKPKKLQVNLHYFSLTFEGLDKHHVRPCLDHVLLGLGIRCHVSKYVSCFANGNLCILIILEKRLNIRSLSFLTFENRSPFFTNFNRANRGFRFVLKDFKPNSLDDSHILTNVSYDELIAYAKMTTVSECD